MRGQMRQELNQLSFARVFSRGVVLFLTVSQAWSKRDLDIITADISTVLQATKSFTLSPSWTWLRQTLWR